MNKNELFKIEQHKLKLSNWEEEFKYYLSQNIETNLELYVIEKNGMKIIKMQYFQIQFKDKQKYIIIIISNLWIILILYTVKILLIQILISYY
jgi:transposase